MEGRGFLLQFVVKCIKPLGEWSDWELAGRAKYRYMQNPTRENLEAFHEAYLHLHAVFEGPEFGKDARFSAELLAPSVSPSERFREEDFFQEQSDISLCCHPRYYQSPNHSHDFFECVYVYSGSCENYMDGRLISMEVGDFCIIPPMQPHLISSYVDDSIVINLLIRKSTFQKSFQPFLSDRNLISTYFSDFFSKKGAVSYLFFRCKQDKALHNLIQNMYIQFASGADKAALRTSFLSLVAHLAHNHLHDVLWFGSRDGNHPPQIVKMLQYISDNLATVTLQSLAQEFGYCSNQCSSILKEATGKTYSRIIQEEKAKQAAQLLLSDAYTIPQIAEMLNYYDTSHFYRAFSSVYGITPKQYRKDHT